VLWASLCRHARLGLHQIADDVGRLDERAGREVRVTLRGLGIGMSQQLLHLIERPARVDQKARERMAQVVQTDIRNARALPDGVPAVMYRVLWPPGVRVPEQPRDFRVAGQGPQNRKGGV